MLFPPVGMVLPERSLILNNGLLRLESPAGLRFAVRQDAILQSDDVGNRPVYLARLLEALGRGLADLPAVPAHHPDERPDQSAVLRGFLANARHMSRSSAQGK